MDPLARWQIAIPACLHLSPIIAITSYLFYKIIKSHRKNNDQQQRIYCTAVMFMTFNWLTAVCVFSVHAYNLVVYVVQGFIVKPWSRYLIWDLIGAFLVLFQNYMLLIALFTRIRGLFASSDSPLSKCTIIFYISALTLLPILLISPFLIVPIAYHFGMGDSILAHGAGEIVSRSLIGATFYLFISLLISLLAMFTAKLKQIQRNKTLNAFIHRQVKMGILTVLVIALLLGIVALAPLLRDKGPDDENFEGYSTVGYLWIVAGETFLVPFHIFCNFLCIALSYRCCDSMFVICCGCLRCCRVIPITTADQNAIFLEQIMQSAREARDGQPKHIEHQEPVCEIVQPVDPGTVPSVPGAPPLPTMAPFEIRYGY